MREFLVIRAPKRKHETVYVTCIKVVIAASKADALRKANISDLGGKYKAAVAVPLMYETEYFV